MLSGEKGVLRQVTEQHFGGPPGPCEGPLGPRHAKHCLETTQIRLLVRLHVIKRRHRL